MDDKTTQMSPRPLGAGSQIDWYNIREVLGMSGLGITYRAHDGKLDREVAIREYLPTSFAVRHVKYSVQPISAEHEKRYAQGLTNFLKVARVLEQFSHDNIIKVYNVIETNNTAYMVMECENGVSLDSIIEQCGTLEQNHQTQIFFPIFKGLQKIHELGFVHCSIKPSNIRIRENGSPVLLDFGSARQTSLHQPMESTALVNQDYMPLEQFSEGYGEQGPWTDIYSLAAIMYQGVVGTKPDEALSRSDHLLRSQPDTVQELSADSHPTYNQVFLSALHAGLTLPPQDRPQSLGHWQLLFEGDLRAYRQSVEDSNASIDDQSSIDSNVVTPPVQPQTPTPNPQNETMKQPSAAPVVGAAAHEPQDELDIALESIITDDEEEEYHRAGVLAKQPEEDKKSSLKSFALACLLLAVIAVAIVIMYLKTNSNYFDSSNNTSDVASSQTTDQSDAAAAADSNNASSGQDKNADGTPATGAATTTEEPADSDAAALSEDFFDKPVPNDTQSDNPRTLSELLESASPFAPMDGMDEAHWKDKTCSDCHAWTRDNLCAQGKFYASGDDTSINRIQHPFDGSLKTALKNWADDDCG